MSGTGTVEKVIVSETTQPVQYLDDDGKTQTLGNVVSRTYKGEDVQRFMFESNRGGEEGTNYMLGASRERDIAFINHVEPMRVLQDNGYVKRDMVLAMGGTELFTVWDNPDGQIFDDPILWDKRMWQHRESLPGTGNLTESIIQRGSIRPGRGVSFRRGFFRMICSNGLVSEVLGLGKVRFNPGNWNPESLQDALFGKDVTTIAQEHIMGERVGNRYAVQQFGSLMKNLREKNSDEKTEYLTSLPKFVRPMVSTFTRVPKWYLKELEKQTEMFDASGLLNIHELDVSNILTNAMNRNRFGVLQEGEERVNRSINFMVENMPSLTENAGSLMGVYSL
ncbi:hypothetical protein LCGC14_1986270 [marine sediment metagenome]|uniref:DUF932 domain-containing protein n=1 Tax=marine sediment metagenome TaxID=412755 RepID=A0A0F9I4K8_9ZZZZ